MGYKAYLNGGLFFDTASEDYTLALTSAKLSLKAGSAGCFTFTIPPQNLAYGTFHKLIDYIDVYREDSLIFSGRVYSIEMVFDTQIKIECEGLLAVLNDSVFRPVTFDGQLPALVQRIINSHNQQVEPGKQITVGNIYIPDSKCYREFENYETSISRLQDLVSSYGGWIRVRKTNGTLYFDWYENYIDGTSQLVDFGENLLDITEQDDSSGIVTVLIPLGSRKKDGTRVTIAPENNGKDYLIASNTYIQKYGYIVGAKTWEDITTAAALKTKGLHWMDACLSKRITIKVKAVDLADAGYDVDAFAVGQKVKVKSAPHGLDGEWFDCQEQNLDLLNPGNNQLSLGTEVIGFTKQVHSASTEFQRTIENLIRTYTTKTDLEAAVDKATSLITGNSGGYVVLHDSDGDAYPDEILVMNTNSIESATQVWRFNKSGLGYSSTGYYGRYGLAMTMDGAIVADRITTGTMSADRIRAGTIQSQVNNTTYWNLNTGKFVTTNAEIGGWKISSSSMYKNVEVSGSEYYRAFIYADSSAGTSTYAFGISHNINGEWTYPFRVNYDGSLISTKGKIGGWSISGTMFSSVKTVSSTQYEAYMYAPDTITPNNTTAFGTCYRTSSGSTYGDWTYPWYVRYDGYMKATKGEIAGWDMTDNYMCHDAAGYRTYIASWPNESAYSFGVAKISPWEDKFYIRNDGFLYAKNAWIEGTIISNNAAITGGSINITSSTESNDTISLWYSEYLTPPGKTVTRCTYVQPRGLWIGSNWLKTSGGADNSGSGTYYQAHLIAQYASINPNTPANKMAVGYSDTYGYRGSYQIRSASSEKLLVEICEGTTHCGWVAVHDTNGTLNAYFAGDGGYCCATQWYTLSDRQRKRDITYLNAEDSARFIYQLKPARFQYKDNFEVYHHGLIAQDVEAVNSDRQWDLVSNSAHDHAVSESGDEPSYKILAYAELTADIIATLQLQHQEIEALKAQVRALSA